MDRIRFNKLRDVETPSRANQFDAGLDFYIPNDLTAEDIVTKNPHLNPDLLWSLLTFFGDNIEKIGEILLPSHTRILIPSGIRVLIEPKESALIVANKSGNASNKGLIYTAQVIDSPYTGEIHLGVYNTTHEPVRLTAGQKLVQLLHVPLYMLPLEEISTEQYDYIAKDWGTRGSKGFGSTDNK